VTTGRTSVLYILTLVFLVSSLLLKSFKLA
jgi:hypothetical protein